MANESKIDQLKTAMKSIFRELNDEDVFHLADFDDKVRVWNLKENSSSVTFPQNIESNEYEAGHYAIDVSDFFLLFFKKSHRFF